MAYVTKDSGKRVDFETGSKRDTEDGKPRFNLIGKEGLLALATFIEAGHDKEADRLMRACFRVANGDYDNSDNQLDDLIALADLMERGAVKYGEHNWTLGQPTSRSFSSLLRHEMQWADGDDTEDHRAAVLFNKMSIIHVEAQVAQGNLPPSLLDHPRYRKAGLRLWEETKKGLEQWLVTSGEDHLAQGGHMVAVHGVLFLLDADAFNKD